jgi:hypothetical protein
MFLAVALAVSYSGCGDGAASSAANIGDTTAPVFSYASDPDPFPALTLTPRELLCAPDDSCNLPAPPVPVVVILEDGAVIGGGYRGLLNRVDRDGRWQSVIGGQGNGPGEYIWPMSGDVDNDGVLTILSTGGGGLRRITYDDQGRHVKTTQVALPEAPEFPLTFMVRGHDTYMLTAHNATTDTASNGTISRVTADAREMTTVAHVAADIAFNDWGGMPISMFKPIPLFDADREGNLYVGNSSTYRIRTIDEDGVLRSTIVVDVAPEKVTQEDLDRVAAARRRPVHGGPSAAIDRSANAQMEEQFQAALRNAPDVFPVLSQLRVLSDRSIWIRRYSRPTADSVRWDAFTADGRPFGTLTTSPSTDIRTGTTKRILMIDKDSLDVPLIRWYDVSIASHDE